MWLEKYYTEISLQLLGQNAKGHIRAVADFMDGLHIPYKIVRAMTMKSNTRFFLVRERNGEIVLTPTKVQLEVVEVEDTSCSIPDEPTPEKEE